MSRMTLLPALALILSACSVEESAAPAAVESVSPATSQWSAPPGEPEVVEASIHEPEVVVAPPVAEVEVASSEPVPIEELIDGEGGQLLEIEVRPGESLVLLGSWSGLTAEAIAAENGIAVTATLYPGQLLELPVTSEVFDGMQSARDDFEDARLDRYLARRGGLLGVTSHTVGTGETAWQVARDHGELPLWVLASFNRGENLDVLRIGQELSLPMLGDSVAMDDEPLEEDEAVEEPTSEAAPVTIGPVTVTDSTIP